MMARDQSSFGHASIESGNVGWATLEKSDCGPESIEVTYDMAGRQGPLEINRLSDGRGGSQKANDENRGNGREMHFD